MLRRSIRDAKPQTDFAISHMQTLRKRPDDQVDQVISFWQPRAAKHLSHQDGREILGNISGFFAVLAEWQRAKDSACTAMASEPTTEAYDGH
jgi:hypothetical protein